MTDITKLEYKVITTTVIQASNVYRQETLNNVQKMVDSGVLEVLGFRTPVAGETYVSAFSINPVIQSSSGGTDGDVWPRLIVKRIEQFIYSFVPTGEYRKARKGDYIRLISGSFNPTPFGTADEQHIYRMEKTPIPPPPFATI